MFQVPSYRLSPASLSQFQAGLHILRLQKWREPNCRKGDYESTEAVDTLVKRNSLRPDDEI